MSRQSGVVCSKCQEVIVGNALNIKNKYYHNECYKCSNCDVSLLVVPFAEKKGCGLPLSTTMAAFRANGRRAVFRFVAIVPSACSRSHARRVRA